MSTIYKHEMKLLYKTLFIWTVAVGGLCFVCILLFNSREKWKEWRIASLRWVHLQMHLV